jgi:competence protein ComEC
MQSRPDNSGPPLPAPSIQGLGSKISTVPLFHAAWLFAAGIALAEFVWLRPSMLLIAFVPVAVLCCIAALRAQRIVWLPLAVLWCQLGTWCGEMEPRPAPSPDIAALSDGLLRTVEGTLTAAGPLRNSSDQTVDDAVTDLATQRVDLRLSTIEKVDDYEDIQAPVDGAVRLTVRWPADSMNRVPARAFECGEKVRAVVRLLPPQVYRDPGAWSRTDYLLDQGITSTASVSIEEVETLGPANRATFACRIALWQQKSSARLLALPDSMREVPSVLRLSEDDAIMLSAMTTGDRTYLTHSLRAGFERTGSFHMLVVSGFHLAIVAGCLFWLARRLRLPRVPATFATIVGSLAYALFTGFATPVQRSLLMVTLYLLGRLFYRERTPLNTIGFAALCLLAASPRSLFDSGFQMTLLAVVSIGGVAVPLLQSTVHPFLSAVRNLQLVAIDVKLPAHLAQFRVILRMIAVGLQRAGSRRIGWHVFPFAVRLILRCIELFLVSCVVELAMTLPMAIYFHRITVFALPVNIVILPLLILLMPAALLTLFVLLMWPTAAFFPAMAAAFLLHAGVGLVHLFGSLAWGDLRIPGPLLWQSLTFCILLGAAIVLACRANREGGSWQGFAAWATLILAAFTVVAPRPIEHPTNALLVEALDVGQGDSLLLITQDGRTLLLDGGGFGGGPKPALREFDIGEEVVSPALWWRGIRHLDVVALSHAHADHMGGLPEILRNFQPTELWVGNNPDVSDYKALLDEAIHLHVRVRKLRAGDGITLGNAKIRVLAPLIDYTPGLEPSNNDSLVLHVEYGATSVLLEGDAEAPIEQGMLSEPDLKSTLLKVGHHGSISSTKPDFLARVTPQWAVISCGLRNRYGHPRQEVLAELEAAKVRTFSTDVNGATCFSLDGIGVEAEPLCGLR